MEDYKEKYECLIKRIKHFHETVSPDWKRIIESHVPEVKEESEDERIRKELIEHIKTNRESGFILFQKISPDEVIAWLEKQGVQETACDKCRKAQPSQSCQDITELGRCYAEHEQSSDKFEPKFKVGDFVVSDYCMGKVIELTNDAYLLDSGQGIPFSCEHDAHIWTIQDAKDGDVLYYQSPLTGIEYIVMSRGVNGYGTIDSYFRYNSKDGFGTNIPSVLSVILNNITPATKEQRNLLFQKMKEEGYEWDAEKKELKIIDWSKHIKCEPNSPSITIVWSEEDEKGLGDALYAIQQARTIAKDENDMGNLWYAENWLKSLKERLKGE